MAFVTSVYFRDPDLADWLFKEANRRGVSFSALVCELLARARVHPYVSTVGSAPIRRKEA